MILEKIYKHNMLKDNFTRYSKMPDKILEDTSTYLKILRFASY